MKIKNFNEIYENMIRQKNPMVDKLQRNKQISAIAFFALVILLFFAYGFIAKNTVVFVIILVLAVLDLFWYLISAGTYNSVYKEEIIGLLVRSYSEGLRYKKGYGVSRADYNAANFPEYYDLFSSEDLIQGNVDNEFNIKMSEVHTQKEEREVDDEGHVQTHYVTVFRGIYGFVNIREILMPEFYVTSNRILGKYNSTRIEIDSAQFEKNYDLYTDQKIETMEIFTADLIEEFNNLRDDLKRIVEVKAHNGNLYFRISMGNSFEAPNFKKSLDFDLMYKNFRIIDNPIRLISKIIENTRNV